MKIMSDELKNAISHMILTSILAFIIAVVFGVIAFFLWRRKKRLDIAGILGAGVISLLFFAIAVHVVCISVWVAVPPLLISYIFIWRMLRHCNHKLLTFLGFCVFNFISILIIYYSGNC